MATLKKVSVPFSFIKSKLLVAILVLFAAQGWGQLIPFAENFSYPAGNLLGQGTWTLQGTDGTNPIQVTSPGLVYQGYLSSGIGFAASLSNNSAGQDLFSSFTGANTINAGSVYIAVLVKVVSASRAGDYFLSFKETTGWSLTVFKGRMYAKDSLGTGNLVFGVTKSTASGTAPVSWTPSYYSFGTTYLVVLKYTFVAGTTNDIVDIYVFDPANPFPATEPATPNATAMDTGGDGIGQRCVQLRQGGLNSAVVNVDGIRAGQAWDATVTQDIAAPVATFNPANGAINVLLTVAPVITFNEPVKKINGAPLTNVDLATLITFKKTDASGASVPFTATINATSTAITIIPSAALENGQLCYIATGPVMDGAMNVSATQSATFTTVSSAISNDATLTDLKVDGVSIAGFAPNVYAYSMEIPFGTTVVPTVTATPTFGLATVAVTPAVALPGATSILVTAQDGTTQLTYSVSFSFAPPSNNASLSSLRWIPNGGAQNILVTGFSAPVLTYNMVIPAEVLILALSATPSQSGATVVITNPANLNGTLAQRTGKVDVTAQDGTTTQTYSVVFSSEGGLSYHFKEGFATFPPANWTYTGNISNSTANGIGLYSLVLSCPKFKWTAPTDGGILMAPTCNTAGSLAFYVRVLDNNPTSQLHLYIEKSTNGGTDWTLLSTDPMPMTGTTTIWHQVIIPVNDNNPEIILRFRGSAFTGNTSTGLFYIDDVSLTMNSAADATLSDIKADGTTIPKFAPNTYSYDVMLPAGSTIVPTITATPSQPGATMVFTNASGLPGVTSIKVTAPDGVATLTYAINFYVTLAAPTNLVATQVPASHVNLSWTDHSIGESAFRIERKPTNGLFVHIANARADVSTYESTDTGLDPNAFVAADRFSTVAVTSGVKFADVVNYLGAPTSLYLDVYEPANDTTLARPVIIWIHGGGFRTDSYRTQGYIVDYSTRFAKRGYVCMSIDYRLRDASAMPTQASEYPALQDAARDANAAISWIKANAAAYHIDPNLIFVAGGSAGGRTAQTVCQFPGPDPTALYPPENMYLTAHWNKTGLIANATLWGGLEPEMRGWVYPYLQPTGVPTILVHGEADVTILPQNSIDLYDTLIHSGISSELHLIPGATHSCLGKETEISAWVASFFAQEWNKVNALATSYTYRVSAYNAIGGSGYSNNAGWPRANNIMTTNFIAEVDINVPGTAWFVVLPEGDPAPTPLQIKAGQNAGGTGVADNFKGSIACTAGKTEYSAVVSGLSNSTVYDVYFVAENAVHKLQLAPTKITVATLAAMPANVSLTGTVSQPVCYNATSTIIVAGTPNVFIVENGGEVTMIAGLKIGYLPGTKVVNGGYMLGSITTDGSWCGTMPSTMVTIGVNDQDELFEQKRSWYKVYPNPTTGIFTLELLNISLDPGVRAEGYGICGEKIFSADLHGDQKHSFSLSHLPSGVYFFRVIAGKMVETIKIIKQ